MRLTLIAALFLCVACGDDPVTPADTSPPADAGPDTSTPIVDWLTMGGPPIASPVLTPCHDGWREVERDGVATCDPYPEMGIASCGPGEAHFPGEPGCVVVGDACPTGAFAEGLPTDGTVTYVDAAASPGGDGSAATPYASLSEVSWSTLRAGATVALAKGTYVGTLPLKAGVTVVGACAAETVVTGVDAIVLGVISVTSAGDPGIARNLTVADAPQYGVHLQSGRHLRLEGVVLERTAALGINAVDTGTQVTLVDSVVRDIQADPGGRSGGRGINIERGARVEATRVAVSENRTLGIFLDGNGTEGSFTDVVVHGTTGAEVGGTQGTGMAVQHGAHVDAMRLVVDSNRYNGISALGAGAEVRVSDTVVRNTEAQGSDRTQGRGLSAQDGALLEAERVLVDNNRDVGIFATISATIRVTDAVILDTQTRERDGISGRGFAVQEFSGAEITRALVVRSHDNAIFVGNDSNVTLEDIVARDTLAEENGWHGHGLSAQLNATVEARRIRLEGNTALGVISYAGSDIYLEDALIDGVTEAVCASTTCAETPFGYGAIAVDATLRLSRFALRGSMTCGAFIAHLRASLDLSAGEVSGSQIGACVQVDGYDLTRLMSDVEFRDNGLNLESTTLPVPDPTGTVVPDP